MRLFITGASGWLGSAAVPALLARGHEVVGLARSDASADALVAAGADVHRGSLDDLASLRAGADASDGVVHLAFKHDLAFTGDFDGAAQADRAAVEALGEVLAGTDRPLLLASGVLGLTPGRVATEEDGLVAAEGEHGSGPSARHATALYTLGLAEKGVRSSVVRLPPTCHGAGDNGFISTWFAAAKTSGVPGYVGDGSNRWPATHRSDIGQLLALAAESAPAGSVLHAVAEEGVTHKAIAEAIGRRLGLEARSVEAEYEYFDFLAFFVGADSPASGTKTQELLGWHPTGPTLLEDLDGGAYG